jgi:hypothetical protein
MPAQGKKLNLAAKVILWGVRGSVVGEFDGIRLSDMRGTGGSFKQTIEEALRLIRDHDCRRYARVRAQIQWIANNKTPSGEMEYLEELRLCMFELLEPPWLGQDALAACYACFLVHEATHGYIFSRGILYDAGTRMRIERLCTREQNRFGARLAAVDPIRYPPDMLRFKFDGSYWKAAGEGASLKKGVSYVLRCLSRSPPEPFAPPNGGPATPGVSSGVAEGPPSVS